MKKRLVLTVMFSMVLAFGTALVGCDTGTGGGDDSGGYTGGGTGTGTGTIKVVNNSQYNWDMIVTVSIGDVTSESNPVLELASISPGGGSKTYSGLTAGHSYAVGVSDIDGTQYKSSTFTLNAGATRTVTYNGDKLTVQ
jgi:hypothetical protein